jgi:hypothetical protein
MLDTIAFNMTGGGEVATLDCRVEACDERGP